MGTKFNGLIHFNRVKIKLLITIIKQFIKEQQKCKGVKNMQ